LRRRLCLNNDFYLKGVDRVLGGFHLVDMIVMLIFFLILMFLVSKFAWGPVMDMMKKREDYVANEIETAEKSRAEAEKANKEAVERLNTTKQEAQQIIEDARNAGLKQEQDIIESAKKEAERIKVQAQHENEKEKALQALQDKVASLSVLIASKVIEKEISAQDQDELISEYIKEVGEER